MSKRKILLAGLLLFLMLFGCGIKPTIFLHPQFNFGFVENVAIIPFDNLSKDQGAGARVTRFFLSELLATQAFEVVEPGEVTRVMKGFSTLRASEFSKEQILELGKELNVQGIFFGSVTESSTINIGGSAVSSLTLMVRMVETETGETVWTATHSEDGKGFLSTVFGVGNKSQSEVARNCVKSIVNTLIN